MIPVLGIPYISRSDLMLRTITSINYPVNELVILDNSRDETCPQVDGARTIKMYRNMGVSWAWNTIIKNTHEADYWVIVNSDLQLGPQDLARLAEKMDGGANLCLVESMALFGISSACVEQVGWFDESFVPAYCEDNDYIYRCKLLGVAVEWITAGWDHVGSATIKSTESYREGNNRSYPMNVRRYREKWGGIMGEEVFTTPFDRGGSPRDTPTLDLSRLKALSWG